MPMIVIAAQLDFKDQKSRDQAVADCAVIQKATRDDEPGCQAYCFAADPSVSNRIQVYELWDDGPSLAAHFKHQNYEDMKVALGKNGITGSWNQMYLVTDHEPVYDAKGQPRETFFGGKA
jgi:quinol monooxygenase YgiN